MDGKARTDDIPVAQTTRFSKTDCLERVQGDRDHRWYRSVTMSMNHAQNWTRPDLAYLVSKAAKFMQAPGDVHLRSLKKGLLDLGLVYDFTRPPEPVVYTDFLTHLTRMMWTRVNPPLPTYISFQDALYPWKTKLHSFVTTSTNHSELVAAAMASREAKVLWICPLNNSQLQRVQWTSLRILWVWSLCLVTPYSHRRQST